MRFRHLPLADLAGFVGVQAEADAQLGFLQAIAHAEFHRRIEGRIAAEDEQHFHGAGIQIFHQIQQRSQLIDGVGFDRVGVEDRLADVAQLLVHDGGERVNDGRLLFARDHDAGAFVRLQIARDGAEPLVDIVIVAGLRTLRDAKRDGQRPGEFLDIAGAQRRGDDRPWCRSGWAWAPTT